MNDLDDVFESEIDQTEADRKIASNEYQRNTEKISKVSYSEGFFATCENQVIEKYDEAHLVGKNYSIEFGKILGGIE
jgi:hypothetical protein